LVYVQLKDWEDVGQGGLLQSGNGQVRRSGVVGGLPFQVWQSRSEVLGVLAGAGSYFQDGTWCHKDVTQFFQNGGFVVFAGLGVRQGGVHLSSPSSGWHTACCVVGDDWFYQSVAFKGKLRDVLCLTNL
jgi:hypothetical protein|tara:strand:+ start:270 stop:656 length:387 start_codon:yes stop_codon:yes gene_type:complete